VSAGTSVTVFVPVRCHSRLITCPLFATGSSSSRANPLIPLHLTNGLRIARFSYILDHRKGNSLDS
jgi:hypothetical protein